MGKYDKEEIHMLDLATLMAMLILTVIGMVNGLSWMQGIFVAAAWAMWGYAHWQAFQTEEEPVLPTLGKSDAKIPD